MESLSQAGHHAYTYKSIWPFFWRVATICIGSFFFGYGFAYFTAIDCVTKTQQLNPTYLFRVNYFFLQGVSSLFAIFGCIINIPLSNNFSRRNCMYIAGGFECIGTVLVLTAIKANENEIDHYMISPQIWIGRAIQGISLGIFSIACPLFIKQLVPIELSVNLGVMHQLAIALGTLTVKLFEYSDMPKWLLFGFPLPLLIIQVIVLATIFKYETPKYWLEISEETKARSFYNQLYKQDIAEQIFFDARTAYQLQNEQNSIINGDYDMDRIMKKAMVIGVYVAILQQLSGISYIILYDAYPDRCNVNLTPASSIPFQVAGTLLQCLATLSLILFNASCCSPIIKKTSQRRVLFQLGTINTAIIMAVSIGFLIPFSNPNQYFFPIQIITIVYMGSYGLTLGPTTWLFLSQTLQRSQMSIAMGFNWLSRFLIIFTFPLMGEQTASNKQILFINLVILLPLLFICFYCNYKYIVQTKNKTRLDIIRAIDANRLPFNLLD